MLPTDRKSSSAVIREHLANRLLTNVPSDARVLKRERYEIAKERFGPGGDKAANCIEENGGNLGHMR